MGRDQGGVPASNYVTGSNHDFLGIYVLNSDAHIDGVTVTRADESSDPNEASGNQRNHAILVTGHDGAHGGSDAGYTVEIENSTVRDFQKTGIFVNGSTLTANIHDNTIIGTHTFITAQNGIQIGSLFGTVGTGDFDGTQATVNNNNITDIGNGGPAGSASGIIVFAGDASGVSITNNTMTGWTGIAQFDPNNGNNGIAFADSDGGTVTGNTISGFDYGLAELNTEYTDAHLATPLSHSGNTYTGMFYANVLLQPDTATGLTFAGSSGHDELNGGSGNDVLSGLGGDDAIDGGAGTDTAVYTGSLTASIMTSVADLDLLTAGDQPAWLVNAGTEGIDNLTSVEKVDDGAGHHFLLVGSGGYPSAINPVTIDLNAIDRSGESEPATLGGTTIAALLGAAVPPYPATTPVGRADGIDIGTDVLINVENATGGQGNDTIIGNSGANILAGGKGDDTLSGGAGNDIFRYTVGDGVDSIDGGDQGEDAGDTLEVSGTAGDDTINVVVNPATPAFAGQELLASGDFNGDGTTDLIWRDPTTGETTTALLSHLTANDFLIV